MSDQNQPYQDPNAGPPPPPSEQGQQPKQQPPQQQGPPQQSYQQGPQQGYQQASQQRPPQGPYQQHQPQQPPQQQGVQQGGYRPPQQQQGPPHQGPPPGYYGGPGYGGQPPNAPPPRKIKRSPLPLIIGVIALLVIGGGSLIAMITGLVSASGGTGGGGGMFSFGDKIAILEVDGVLGAGPTYPADTERLKAAVNEWKDDESIKGMVIRVNSPGGAVSATQDLFYAIEEFRAQGKPVYTSMGDIAASGGYYAAMGSDEIYVNTGTLTGSIGVILNFYGYEELLDKVGLESRTFKSGEFKDIGSGSRPLSEEEKALLDEMVKDVFEQFFEVVMANREEAVREVMAENKMAEMKLADEGFTGTVLPSSFTPEQVEEYLRGYCDGRIFSGRQALAYGMADKEGTFDQTVDAMRATLGLPSDSPIVLTPKPKPQGLFGKVNQKIDMMSRYEPGSVHMEFRFTM